MKALKAISIIAAMLAVVFYAATAFVESTLSAKAETYQRIELSPEAALFGDPGTKIGSPQKFIIEDPKAILNETDENGNKLLDENYLQENDIYPLQLKSVQSTSSYIKLASIGALVLFVLLTIFSHQKIKASHPKSEPTNSN